MFDNMMYLEGKENIRFQQEKVVMAVKFIVIAVHATSWVQYNIMNGDMFYNLKFEIHLLLLLLLLIWFVSRSTDLNMFPLEREKQNFCYPLSEMPNRIQWLTRSKKSVLVLELVFINLKNSLSSPKCATNIK